MQIHELIATVFVDDKPRAWEWYSRLLGRPWDAEPDQAGCRAWEIRPGSWLQVVGRGEDDASTSVALAVPSATAARHELRSRGIDAAEPWTIDGFATFVEVRDPEGNTITLVEHLAGGTRDLHA
ncbi:VOC family protein [Arsenicicoccus sp. oral taxon 190]|uniref:VOC family protein n=1 Tax=Arsenicicoccus sp. oral taxon 190 TaxID=1658671 RepID=UPI0012E2A9C4|nr:VOC family protein [Arsenicicoccus sp. oral taxon 190]